MKKDRDSYSPRITKKLIVIIITALLLLAVIVGLFMAMQPQRTVANFCKVAKEEKPTLVGDVNCEKRLETYKNLRQSHLTIFVQI